MENKYLSWFIGFCDAFANFQSTLYKRLNKENKIINNPREIHERTQIIKNFLKGNDNNFSLIPAFRHSEKIE